jgi:SAM-dependent methyltransferase
MWLRSLRPAPVAGSRAYSRQLEEELEHYSALHEGSDTFVEPAPEIWNAALDRAAERVKDRTGADLLGHIAYRLNQRGDPPPRLLSLGCGAAGVEMAIARQSPDAEIHCVDVNPVLLRMAEERARVEGLRMSFLHADLNTARLPLGTFSVVLCHAALHHLIALEHVFGEIRRCLGESGQLIVIDIVSRNGYRMFPKTKAVASSIFATLPPRYRVNHTAYAVKMTDKSLYSPPAAMTGMECQRSEEILPLLRANFVEREFVPYFSLCRRFFDSMYGPNYDLSRPLDQAILTWIWELDCQYLDSGGLEPETFFGIFTPH